MDKDLAELLGKARTREMTGAETAAQRESFICGNWPHDRKLPPKRMIRDASHGTLQ